MDIKAEALLVGILVPENPLCKVQLNGTQIKDDYNEFVELASWRRSFKKPPYVKAMRIMTY
jgi:hypothetical protein